MFPALCRANDPAPDVCGFIPHESLFLSIYNFTNHFSTVAV